MIYVPVDEMRVEMADYYSFIVFHDSNGDAVNSVRGELIVLAFLSFSQSDEAAPSQLNNVWRKDPFNNITG